MILSCSLLIVPNECAMDKGVALHPGMGFFTVLGSGLPLVSCKSAVAMPSVKVVYTRRGPSSGYFSCTCHLEACNKFYGPGFIEHRGRGIEVPCLDVRLMFWRKQARSDERFDRSQPTFWGGSQMAVSPTRISRGEQRAPLPAVPRRHLVSHGRHLSLPQPVSVKRIQPAVGRMSRLGTGGDNHS